MTTDITQQLAEIDAALAHYPEVPTRNVIKWYISHRCTIRNALQYQKQALLAKQDEYCDNLGLFEAAIEEVLGRWRYDNPEASGQYLALLDDGEMLVTFWNDGTGKNADTWGEKRNIGWLCEPHIRVMCWQTLPAPPANGQLSTDGDAHAM